MKRIGLLSGLFLAMTILIMSCEKDNNEISQTETNTTTVTQKGIWPDVTWQIGISADLWKPKYECLKGIGICRINAVFVEFDWTKHQAPINLGVTPGNHIILEFEKSINIPKYAEQDYIDVEEGDEKLYIDDKVIAYFKSKDIDISNISLVQGHYLFEYNKETGNYFLNIPYKNN
jgi:hypothetical protein